VLNASADERLSNLFPNSLAPFEALSEFVQVVDITWDEPDGLFPGSVSL
jgi:hypothetical protein